ncbi:MAG: hypothetical protein Q4D91_10085 [Lautropia sp.]|nr:hypothetical protein [Lautropia sp.]
MDALRQAKPKRGTRRTTAASTSFVPPDLRIRHRPPDIEDRLMPGHWEGDLIKGAYNRSAVRVLVERQTRYVDPLPHGRLHGTGRAGRLLKTDKNVPAFLRNSLTYDRGRENGSTSIFGSSARMRPGNEALTKTQTGCYVSFCPKAPTCPP